MLVKSLQEIADSRIDSGLNGIEQVLKANPNFRLAHLIKGDMLLARARPISDMGETGGLAQQQITDLREEARARVRRHLEPVPSDRVPKYLLKMQPEQKYAALLLIPASPGCIYIRIWATRPAMLPIITSAAGKTVRRN